MQNGEVVKAHSGNTLISCCPKAKSPGLSPLSSKLLTQSFLSTSIWCKIHYTVCASSAVQFCSDSASASESFSITPYCLGLPWPCRRPVQHPSDLWSLTCRRPAGCPVVHGSQMVGQHLGRAHVHGHLDQQNHHDHAVHRGLSNNTNSNSDWIAQIKSQQFNPMGLG